MKKVFLTLLIVATLMLSVTITAFAAGPVEYTIDVRNRTGQSVEFNYTTSDGNIHTTTIPAGVNKITLPEGIYSFWADPKCGHIAGAMNLNQSNQILWVSCESEKPVTALGKPNHSSGSTGASGMAIYQDCTGHGAYAYEVLDWDFEWESATAWKTYGYFCFDTPAVENDTYPASVWFNGVNYDYEYHQTGIECVGWVNPGEAFCYYSATYGWCPGNNPP